jgi:hypothetical protein
LQKGEARPKALFNQVRVENDLKAFLNYLDGKFEIFRNMKEGHKEKITSTLKSVKKSLDKK